MTAKEYLQTLWKIDEEMKTLHQQLQDLREKVGILARPDPNENVGYSGNVSDPTANMAIKLERMERKLNRKINIYVKYQEKITDQIDGMDDRTDRMLLRCRYILMQTWDQVAESIGFDRSYTIQKLHPRALRAFSDKYLKVH